MRKPFIAYAKGFAILIFKTMPIKKKVSPKVPAP